MGLVSRALSSPSLLGVLAVVRLLPRVSPGRTAALALTTVVVSLVPVLTIFATGQLVGSVPAAAAAGLESDAAREALTLLAGVALLVALGRVLQPFHDAIAGDLARAVNRHLQTRLIAAVARPAGIAHLEDPETLDLIKNAEGVGADGLHPGEAVRSLASLFPSWAQALGAGAVVVTFNPVLGLLWLALWPVVLAILMREFLRAGRAAAGQAAAVRRAEYYLGLALDPAAAKELRVWGMLDWLVDRYDAAWARAMLPIWRARSPNRLILWGTAALVVAVNFGAYALLAVAAVRGDLTLAALAVYVRAVQAAGAFRASDDANRHLAYAAVAVPSLLALERRVAALTPTAPPVAALPPDAPRESIRFEDVTFRYARDSQDVLTGLNLEIPAGRSLAIVGANGAGKTTLIKLLCGLYVPTTGRVTVDGVDLRDVDPSAWQRRVAAIFQDFVQYHLSARDNVLFGAPDAAGFEVDDDTADTRLRDAAQKVGALDLIESPPHGWETVLSRRYANGTDLSGGQWQRIALARALFAASSGARVLILDEPTAALDVRAEAALYDRFLEITRGLTTIVISHRFSTVRRADQIVVVDAGRVVERGTHDALIAAGGRYAAMFALQAARFADDAPANGAAERPAEVARAG